jgi:hypothetical protein
MRRIDMDDFLILPDENTIEILAREYAKLKRRAIIDLAGRENPAVGRLGFDDGAPAPTLSEKGFSPDGAPRENRLIGRVRLLTEQTISFLQFFMSGLADETTKPLIRRLISKKRLMLLKLGEEAPPSAKRTRPPDQNLSLKLFLQKECDLILTLFDLAAFDTKYKEALSEASALAAAAQCLMH